MLPVRPLLNLTAQSAHRAAVKQILLCLVFFNTERFTIDIYCENPYIKVGIFYLWLTKNLTTEQIAAAKIIEKIY
jgi:hypothetical protein